MISYNNRYCRDNSGEIYLPKTSTDNILDLDTLTKGTTDWIEFIPLEGVPNTAFKESGDGGFNCSYRIFELFGLKIKTVRINLSKIKDNMTIANLPLDLTQEAHSWYIRTPNTHLPVIISLRPSGKLSLVLNKADTTPWSDTDYIYGTYTWIE